MISNTSSKVYCEVHFRSGGGIPPRWPRTIVKGVGYRIPMICHRGNNLYVTLVRQMALAARQLNAPAESGRGVQFF